MPFFNKITHINPSGVIWKGTQDQRRLRRKDFTFDPGIWCSSLISPKICSFSKIRRQGESELEIAFESDPIHWRKMETSEISDARR
jgi:hypothetical protein